MTEYVLNVECKEVKMGPDYSHISTTLFFQIDVHGNVTIKKQCYDVPSYNNPNTGSFAPQDIFILHDNIPIPKYMIEVFKQLLPVGAASRYSHIYWPHYLSVIESIKICKQKIKEDLEQDLEQDKQKIKEDPLLKSERRRRDLLLEEIKQLETQLESARHASKCNDLIRDNEKLKTENKELWESIERKKNESTGEKKKPSEPVSYYQRHFQRQFKPTVMSHGWHNPGGADICTPSNAQNSMVYNASTGIYEPGSTFR